MSDKGFSDGRELQRLENRIQRLYDSVSRATEGEKVQLRKELD
ncbi:MAG: hypothetical protein AABW71_04820 [Nanoarchaeota archaeon]